MPNKLDHTGKIFGKLKVLKEGGRSKNGDVMWFVECKCGNQKEVKGVDLIRGYTKSCGCLVKENSGTRTHGLSRHPLYPIYTGMISRCHDKNNKAYKWYGEKGIKVCERWYDQNNFSKGFNNFVEDMGEKPDGCSLDRLNPWKGYSPRNCAWRSFKEQINNRKGFIVITRDKLKSLIEHKPYDGIALSSVGEFI